MKPRHQTLGWTVGFVLGVALVLATSARAKDGLGTISGVVLDHSGTPQMGASVWLISEEASENAASRILSDQNGAFFTDHVKPGKYLVRVSLAGFLPTTAPHVPVVANLTTLLRVQVESLFSSLDTLRRKSDAPSDADDWKWVLRSSTSTRPILQWNDSSDVNLGSAASGSPEVPRNQHPRARVEVTSGGLRPGFASAVPAAPATAVSYDQQVGSLGRVLVAGLMSYEKQPSGSFASVWLPSGNAEFGPQTVFVWRQSKIGAEGMGFEGIRLDHTERIALGNHFKLQAGAEFLHAGIVSSTSSLRPHAVLDATLGPGWTAALMVAANPPSELWEHAGELESVMGELDSLPPVLFHNGNPVLEGGWHQEVSVKHKLANQASVEIAAFHDSLRDQAIFGNGPAANPDFIQDAFSTAFLYDGGNSSSWGGRLAYTQNVTSNLEVAAIYAWAGALTPEGALSVSPELRSSIATSDHHSLAARVSGKIPQAKTEFSASYKWVSDTTLSRMDAFGEAAYQIDPNLHLSIRQPLPGTNGRWEALADFSNLLAQGYVTLNGDNSKVTFIPVLRSFRGGVSFQF